MFVWLLKHRVHSVYINITGKVKTQSSQKYYGFFVNSFFSQPVSPSRYCLSWAFPPPASAIDVIESIPFVCVSGFVRATMSCTTDLSCAPPTCVVHHGAQGGQSYTLCVWVCGTYVHVSINSGKRTLGQKWFWITEHCRCFTTGAFSFLNSIASNRRWDTDSCMMKETISYTSHRQPMHLSKLH